MLSKRGGKLKSARIPELWFLTDDARAGDPIAAVLSLPPGAGVIFRHYGTHDRAGLADKLAKLSRARGLVFLVAGDWRLAAKTRADGLHLPEYAAARGLPSGARLWRRQRQGLLTVAAHSARSLARARELGADAALLAPVFPTRSHPGRSALGPVRAAALARRAGLPVLALGGATPEKMSFLRAAGFAGIAGIGFALTEKG